MPRDGRWAGRSPKQHEPSMLILVHGDHGSELGTFLGNGTGRW